MVPEFGIHPRFGVLKLRLEQVVQILFRQVYVAQFGQPKLFLHGPVGRRVGRVVDEAAFARLGDVVPADEIEELLDGQLVFEGLELEQPHHGQRVVDDEEVPEYGVRVGDVYRPRLQARLHHPEGILDPP